MVSVAAGMDRSWAKRLILMPYQGIYGGFPKLGVSFGGPYSKDNRILGSILGSPLFVKLL